MRSYAKVFALAAFLVLAIGCAKEPVEEIKAVEAEIAAVRTDEVRTYAPASLDKAEKAAAAFTQEIATQKDKFALSRNYEQAIKLAGEAKSAAKAASSDAVAAKEKMRQETRAKIDEARMAVEAAMTELGTAPVGKGNKAEIEAMKVELEAAQGTFTEMESRMEAERFQEARTMADEALATATRVSDAVRMAKEMKAAGGRRT